MKTMDAICLTIAKLTSLLLIETLSAGKIQPESYNALREAQAKIAIFLSPYEVDDAA